MAPRGIRLIVAYKLTKGAAEIVLAVALGVMVLAGHTQGLVHLAEPLRRHVTGEWSVKLAAFMMALTARRRLWELVGALAFDAALTLLEGLALRRGTWWGPWLVVVATSGLLPFEIMALVRHVHLGRLLILAVNVVIVAYLAGRAVRHHARAKVRWE